MYDIRVTAKNPYTQGEEFDFPAGSYSLSLQGLSGLKKQFDEGAMSFTQPARSLSDLEREINRTVFDLYMYHGARVRNQDVSVSALIPDCDNFDEEHLNAQTENLVIMNIEGTPAPGQKIVFKISSDSTYSLSWDDNYHSENGWSQLTPSLRNGVQRFECIWDAEYSGGIGVWRVYGATVDYFTEFTGDNTAANKVLASPPSGFDGKITARALVAADIPSLSSIYQPLDATLTSLAGQNWALNSIPVGSGADTVSQLALGANTIPGRSSTGNIAAKTFTDLAYSLADDATQGAMQTTLGLVIGTNVQAYNANLTTLAGLTATTDNFIVSVANAWASRTPAQVRTTLGLVIGTNVQAYDAELAALASLTSAANKLPYFTGSGTAALADFTPAGFSLTLSANASIGGTHSGTSSGLNTGDQTITLTGDVTGSGTGSFAATIANNAVTLAKMATMATASILGRNTAGAGNVEVLSASTTRSLLGLVIGTNVQAWDTELDSLAGLGVIQGDLIYGSAANTYSKLAKNTTATRYLSNTGTSNNPAWAQIDLTNGVTGILPGANGGSGNGFFAVSGPATSLKTFTLPNASATILTSNTAVTIAQGGTNATSFGTTNGGAYFDGTRLVNHSRFTFDGTYLSSVAMNATNGNTTASNTGEQIRLNYNVGGGVLSYPHFISTTHNAGVGTGNAIDFWTSDGTSSGVFPTNGVFGMRIENANVKIGGTANRGTTAGTNQLALFNGTAPVGTLTNGASLYTASGEMKAMNASGTAYTVTGTKPVSEGGTGVTTSTGSGSVVLSTSPTFSTSMVLGSDIVGAGTRFVMANASADVYSVQGQDSTHNLQMNWRYNATAGNAYGEIVTWGYSNPLKLDMSALLIGSNNPMNVKIGGTANRGTTEGTNQLVIFNGTAPVGTLTNGASFYAASGEMRVMDSAGNSTLLSPHDKFGNWIHDEVNYMGRRLRVDLERMLTALDDMLFERLGERFVESYLVDKNIIRFYG